jgi:hypothetical protein
MQPALIEQRKNVQNVNKYGTIAENAKQLIGKTGIKFSVERTQTKARKPKQQEVHHQ